MAAVPATFSGEVEVHVWTADLCLLAADIQRWSSWLSTDEVQQTGRFRRREDQRRYAAGRGWVRGIIAQYTGQRPNEVVFRYGEQGKPELDMAGPATLHFNVSHSIDVIAMALTRVAPIGVDVERVALPPEAVDIARTHFSPGECAAFDAVAPEERALAFTRCWTRKEAFVKAIGQGLSCPLQSFDVTVTGAARLLSVRGDPETARNWSLADCAAPTGFVIAIAVAAGSSAIRIRQRGGLPVFAHTLWQ